MIHFEVIKSSDENVLEQFNYFQNQIYIGKNQGDLWINDNELMKSHIMLEVIGNDLLVHPQKEVPFYLINGKRASAIRKLKIGDQVTIGKTILQITHFAETEKESKKQILNKKLNELIETNASRLSVIEALSKLMKL
jgi:hypothetical protein